MRGNRIFKRVTTLALACAMVLGAAPLARMAESSDVTAYTGGKTKSTFYTAKMVAAARENVKKYDWAKAELDSATAKSEKYIGKEEQLWNMVTTQELPRGITVGYRFDPNAYTCHYCGVDLRAKYGSYPYKFDPINKPWKIQCPDCQRYFPSNDFEGFYKLGLDENGNFRYEQAKTKNAELVAKGEDGYLKNVLYPEKGEGWGVDDGYGYNTGNKVKSNQNGKDMDEVWTYIAYYNHWGLWHNSGVMGTFTDVLTNVRNAYLYTGDEKYGRVGAILIDRIADVYPEMKLAPYYPNFSNSDGSMPCGKIIGAIWETGLANLFSYAYDAFYPMYDDPYVVDFLHKKAVEHKFKNKKNTPSEIHENCESGLMREIDKGVRNADINGNFGFHQASMTYAAVVLDSEKETKAMLEWVFRSNPDGIIRPDGKTRTEYSVPGGNMLTQIMDVVSRDGIGTESAPGYNGIWVSHPMALTVAINNYGKAPEYNLFKNPKYVKMFYAMAPLTTARNNTVGIGDQGNTATTILDFIYPSQALTAYINTRDPRIAQVVYLLNKGKLDKLHADIFTQDPEVGIRNEIQSVIDKYGEWDLDKCDMLPAYGFSILRDGGYYQSVTGESKNTQQDFWMYYGLGESHQHADALNLGMEAYGLNIAPELGYPVSCDGGEEHLNWTLATISHNTIQVDEFIQESWDTPLRTPLHFDDSGYVKVMDADAHVSYPQTSIYRRTVVSVKASDDVSYGIDFFRVKGGDDHVYSFHSQSNDIAETSGLTLKKQETGTYAGPDVPWKTAGIRSGYAYLYDVRSSANVEDYMVDFKVTDFRKVLPDNPNLHLRLRMLNDFKLNDVSLAKGNPPAVGGNIKTLEFLLARRTGKDLDSLFTTVLEPYKDNSYIKSAEKVTMTATETEGKDDVAKAVKVTLNNGRIDYVIYATNNKIKYRVDNSFDFKGCIGVQSIMDGKVVNSYINDGTQLGEVTGQDAATGKVVSFTKELSAENELVVKMDSDIQLEKLNNQFIYIKNTSKLHNGVYPINGARKLADGNIAINVGDTTFIENFKDAKNVNGGYNYNIEEGQTFRIPLATTQNAYPRFKAIDKQIGKVGNPMTFKVASTSADGKALKATAIALPRGANFDAESGKFSWTPGINSFGDNFAAFTVTDGKFSETQHVNIDVKDAALGGDGYRGMFGSAKTDTVEFDVAPNGCTVTTKVGNVVFPKGAIGEGKRGALTMQSAGPQLIVSLKVDGSPYALEAPVKVTSTYAKGSEAKNENCVILRAGDSSLVANARVEGGKLSFYTKMLGTFSPYYYPKSFGDMSNYKWAKPATERLAARGIINGVTENAFAPGANITRADFAVLVVRALGLNAKTGENFADVPSGAYYANEVSIAKSLGIVNGSSGNKFNPTAQISREDMMVMMARALEKTGYSLKANAMAEFTDSAQVSAYAKDAVAKLTKSGLIGGSNGRINPKGKTIRGEVAVLIDRVIFMAR